MLNCMKKKLIHKISFLKALRFSGLLMLLDILVIVFVASIVTDQLKVAFVISLLIVFINATSLVAYIRHHIKE